MKGWICYPLWGLELAENGIGIDRPIFGDATLVTRGFIERYCPPDPRNLAAGMFSGGGMRAVLAASQVDHAGPAPVDRLIDIPPGSFIAVRRQKPDDAQRYAESIRALLTGTSVLTSGVAKGFAMTPLPLQWAAIPSRVQLDPAGNLQTQYTVVASNFIYLTPVVVSHRQLTESWTAGAPILGSWRVYRDDPLSKALVGEWAKLTTLRRRIRQAASTLARAMESSDSTLSTLLGVVALETLLKDGASSFQEIEQLASCVFEGTAGPPEIARLFSNRHKIAHEGHVPQGEREHSREISAAWGLILLAVLASAELSTPTEFLEHLRGRVLARRVGDQLRAKDLPDLATQVEQAARTVRKSSDGAKRR
jgi:hypothetical protein